MLIRKLYKKEKNILIKKTLILRDFLST